jgi:two-component system invasion response regulator UvrY
MADMTAEPVRARFRVLIVDDQRMFRRAAAALVGSVADLEVVGEAESGEQAVQVAARLRPELVLMDVRLPGIDGAEAARRILATVPGTRIMLVSTYERQDLPPDIDDCGATGFLRKQDLDAISLQNWAYG